MLVPKTGAEDTCPGENCKPRLGSGPPPLQRERQGAAPSSGKSWLCLKVPARAQGMLTGKVAMLGGCTLWEPSPRTLCLLVPLPTATFTVPIRG